MNPPPQGAEPAESLSMSEIEDAWRLLDPEDRLQAFRSLVRTEAEDFFLALPARDQGQILGALPPEEQRSWMRLLPPDDVADLLQEVEFPEREKLLALLDAPTRREVSALLAYAEDQAGGLMNPRYARVRPDLTVDEAIRYLRQQGREHLETIYTIYVLDEAQKLLGVVSLRELFMAPSEARVRDVMQTDVVTVSDEQDQESVTRVFAEHDLNAIPVVDHDGRMKGIVTVDDIVDVVQEEATEDIQKFGGTQPLGAPYLDVGVLDMVRRRAPWLTTLFLGEMLTATAMARFEHDIARAVVLAMFVPLIISSGGNSGSQASTLVIRAMALGEVRLGDWWRVVRREIGSGAFLGALLGVIGALRIFAWQAMFHTYGPHATLIAATVAVSLVGVVLFGTFAGSLLPFILRRLGLDPASASAPFVATLVDVTGLVIYFSVASVLLAGTLL